ncbi:capsular polysacchardie synthesis protein [Serinicoccus hydrothermalis]|uniref:Capsular polysacchardie synthesis protein n=1 Tax=Serinicoccus hydrothermalis TaxID=1758689 RepID=A0A1B1N959_9MICO|nr:glycosyltransferase [Serinicoccus hydrothermalis]ANS77941.1 capsular polysacchardie synthesis protein [Serinicoccus hydrothermalis]
MSTGAAEGVAGPVLPAVDVDVVVAVHDVARPVWQVVHSALRGADLRGVVAGGPRIRVTVACHEVDEREVRRRMEDGLAGRGEDASELAAHVRYLTVRDGLRSPAGPFNAGILAADGRYVSIIGSDDRYADGALPAWVRLADELGSAWLMARVETEDGEAVPTPRTRPGRSRDLDLVADRLAYRTAPLGLLRREALDGLGLLEGDGPLTTGLQTGEDVELSLRLAASGERVDLAREAPAYVIGTRGESRTTSTTRPVADELAAHARLLDLRWVRALPEPAREAIAVKTLRIHVLAAVRRRPAPLDWSPGEAAFVRDLTRGLLTMAPGAERALHRADRALLDAVLVAPDTDALAAASAARGEASRWDILLTPDPRANLAPEATVRAHAEAAVSDVVGKVRTAVGGRHTLHDAQRPRVLVLSFSPIARDARVLKQVRHLSREFDVVTCGYGPAPDGVVGHVEVPADRQNALDGRLITLRSYRAAYTAQAGVRWALRHLPRGAADVVLANDLDAVPLALWLAPRAGVHADLHEFFPLLHEEDEAWMRRISPYQEWLCRTFLPRCASVTTVSGRIAAEYTARCGVEVGVVTNASPYAALTPTPVHAPVRLVHSGACLRNRHLPVMTEAVVAAAAAGSPVTLDLYLTSNDPGHLEELRRAARESGGVVRVHDAVPYADLIGVLNAHDVGIHVLPPLSFNNTHALPNKVFDYVQARLGLLVGPSPEMARLVREHGVGVVADGFDVAAVTAAVAQVQADRVAGWKQAAARAARELSDERQSPAWVRAVQAVADGARGGRAG